MYKIMFVCMGNVCRSPLAQILLEDYLKKIGLADKIIVESSGVNVYSEGQRACDTIRKVSAERGIPFNHYSRRFVSSDIEGYDLILSMDEETMSRIKIFAQNKKPKGNINFFRKYDPIKDNSREVPDPWGEDTDQGVIVFTMIERTLKHIVESIKYS